MVHEIPDQKKFFTEIHDLMKPEGLFLLVEPVIHVSKKSFSQTLETAKGLGIFIKESPQISMSRSALFIFGKTNFQK
jgi:hypothetical protein